MTITLINFNGLCVTFVVYLSTDVLPTNENASHKTFLNNLFLIVNLNLNVSKMAYNALRSSTKWFMFIFVLQNIGKKLLHILFAQH